LLVATLASPALGQLAKPARPAKLTSAVVDQLPPAAAPVVAKHALVVSAHPAASKVGRDIMQQGGNAYDAAVAVQFALAVVLPVAGNIGGGGFIVYRDHSGTAGTLDFRETAPAAASRDMYLDASGNVVPGLSTAGPLAVGTPGTVAGMEALHKKLGKLPWAKLVAPAVRLARYGVALTDKEAAGLNRTQADFTKYNPGSLPVFVQATAWQKGDTLKQPELATTLQRIQDQGRAGFYQGKTA